MSKPSTDWQDIEKALSRLVARLTTTDAEFPDEAWSVACAFNVNYDALVDAYDEYCANS